MIMCSSVCKSILAAPCIVWVFSTGIAGAITDGVVVGWDKAKSTIRMSSLSLSLESLSSFSIFALLIPTGSFSFVRAELLGLSIDNTISSLSCFTTTSFPPPVARVLPGLLFDFFAGVFELGFCTTDTHSSSESKERSMGSCVLEPGPREVVAGARLRAGGARVAEGLTGLSLLIRSDFLHQSVTLNHTKGYILN